MKNNYIETEYPLVIETYQVYQNVLEKNLSFDKIKHCISTANFAVKITLSLHQAELLEKVVISALLHDFCREWDKQVLIQKAIDYQIPISAVEEKHPVLLHGPISAMIVAQDLEITDNDVFEAIYWHTTGKAHWCLVGQILYLADFSEPLRDYPQATQARNILDTDGFVSALLYSAEERYELSKKKRDPSPYSLEFLTWLKQHYVH